MDNYLDKIICGDCLELLKKLPPESVDLVITSPPYFQQREYENGGIGNEKTASEYVSNLLKIFEECVRVTKPTGSIVFNLGDKYYKSSLLLVPYMFAFEVLKKENVKLVNNITWIKQNPTPRQFRRRLVSSTEPFFHFVKSENYYYDLDAFEVSRAKKSVPKNGENVGKKYFQMIETSELSDLEKKTARRELEQIISEVKSKKIESFRMKIRGLHSLPFGGQEGGRKTQILKKGFTIIRILGNGIKKDAITTPVETIKGLKHPAIYPEYIIGELLKLLTKKDAVVLDPFMGSGTTAVACRKLDRRYIGFEISPEYCRLAEDRIRKLKYQRTLSDTL